MLSFELFGFRLSLENSADAIASNMDIGSDHSLTTRLPQVAFTIACLSFSILAAISIWGTLDRNDVVTKKPSKTSLKKQDREVRFELPEDEEQEEPKEETEEEPKIATAQNRNGVSEKVLLDQESHIAKISQLTSACAELSGILHRASIGTDSLRSLMPLLLDEISAIIGSLCQTQQLLAKDPTCFFSKTGMAAVFETTSTSILASCQDVKEQSETGAKIDLESLLSQARSFRSTLEFLRTSLEPRTPFVPQKPSAQSQRLGGGFAPAGHKRSLTVPNPQPTAPAVSPVADIKKWIEEPPHSESVPDTEQLPEYSVLPIDATTKSNISAKRNVVSLADIHDALKSSDNEYALRKLVDTNIDPNATYGRWSRTAIHEAARMNAVACIELLVRAGALVDVDDNKGDSPLHLAAWEGHVEAGASLIKAGADIDRFSGRDGCTPLFCAISGRHIDLVRLLLKKGARVGMKSPGGDMYPLHQASVTGQTAICSVLLDAGAQVDAVDKEKNTPLHYAATIGKVDTIKLLIKEGANVDAKQEKGMTPLHWACHKGHDAAVKILLDAGADEDDKAAGGATPLCCAASRGHFGCAKVLLKRGADPNLAADSWDGGSGTPLQLARSHGHKDVVALLKSHTKA